MKVGDKLTISIEQEKISSLFNEGSTYYIKGGYYVLYKGSYNTNSNGKTNKTLEFQIIQGGNEKIFSIDISFGGNCCVEFKKWQVN